MANTILTKTRDQQGREISTFKAFQFTMSQINAMNDSTIKALKGSLKYMNTLVSHTSVESTTHDSLIKVPIRDTICKKDDSTKTVRAFCWHDRWITVNGQIFSSYLNMDYSLTNVVTVDYYWKRTHWWEKQYLSGAITQENPHTATGKVVQFTVISPQGKWYDKWWVHLIGGGVGGILVDHYLMK
jgi:hypothetical protein